MTIGGHSTSPADGLGGLGDMPCGDQRVEGPTEYTAQDVTEASDEEPDRTKEALTIQRATRRLLQTH